MFSYAIHLKTIFHILILIYLNCLFNTKNTKNNEKKCKREKFINILLIFGKCFIQNVYSMFGFINN